MKKTVAITVRICEETIERARDFVYCNQRYTLGRLFDEAIAQYLATQELDTNSLIRKNPLKRGRKVKHVNESRPSTKI
jgi:hypothetical protein